MPFRGKGVQTWFELFSVQHIRGLHAIGGRARLGRRLVRATAV